MTDGKLIFLLVIKFFMLITLSNATDYCRINSCRRNEHTACIYTSDEPSKQCTHLVNAGLSNADKRRIINLHNSLREKSIAEKPGGGRAPRLSWDNELAKIAQKWANQCNFNYDKCRNVERGIVTQNIGYRLSPNRIESNRVDSIIHKWYDQVTEGFKYTNVDLSKNGKLSHYSKLIQPETRTMGCGAVNYKVGEFYRLYLVCNYGPVILHH